MADEINRSRGTAYGRENVAIQPGGKPVIAKLVWAIVNPGEQVLYPNPGYPIYESQIEFNGGEALAYTYREGPSNFEVDLSQIERLISNRTRLIIYDDLQNPTAAESSRLEMERIADLAKQNNLLLLSDEAYFDIRFAGSSQSIAALPGMAERTVILYTFSKKYAMTGWRLGAAIGPPEIIQAVSRLNVNLESCTNHFVQWAGVEALTGDQSGARQILATLRERRDKAVELMKSISGVRCFKTDAIFYLFPNFT